MIRRGFLSVASTLVLGFYASAGMATIIYTIDTGNPAVTGTGPYAQVSVTRTTSTTADIIFTSLMNPTGTILYRMGNGATADLNVNGTYSLGAVTETGTTGGFTPSFNNNAPGNVNGFGFFNLSLNNNDGYGDSATTISFTLTRTGGGTWANDAAVLTPNANDAVAAIHVFGCAITTTAPTCSASSSALFTGFAAGGTPGGGTPREITVPEPSALMLLGIGALALVYGRRQRVTQS